MALFVWNAPAHRHLHGCHRRQQFVHFLQQHRRLLGIDFAVIGQVFAGPVKNIAGFLADLGQMIQLAARRFLRRQMQQQGAMFGRQMFGHGHRTRRPLQR